MPGTGHRPILIVEDSDEDFETLRWAFAKLDLAHPIKRCVTGDEALAYLNEHSHAPKADWPLLILLDLNLPGTDGREFLTELKNDARARLTPVIVLTTSSNPRDVRASYAAGANAYMIKPLNLEKLNADLRALCEFWLRAVTLPVAEDV
jgi:CheY-like chemotaxis protein